ncbi:MAG: response regulator [Candidatus Tectomicrobia bacterium]|uniref:Response regulator n=1 Tax=Tectimicrobiota bacterium TaxID=2528274 RepID=A0A932FVF4_UNCTE|nr:response regulator [Candidatus Tectomicrobia bacterium]
MSDKDRPRILLVEDNRELQEMFRVRLEMEGFEIAFADDGRGCLKALEEQQPDLILLDLFMPVMDGYQVLETLSNTPLYSEIPVVVFSVEGNPREIERAVALGAVEYIVKGKMELERVVARIQEILAEGRARSLFEEVLLDLLVEKGIVDRREIRVRLREKRKEALMRRLKERRS